MDFLLKPSWEYNLYRQANLTGFENLSGLKHSK
jgi:hypothetical protein